MSEVGFIWEKIVSVVKTPIKATFVVDFNLNVELSFPYECGGYNALALTFMTEERYAE